MMTPERWQQVKELLGHALELEPSQRTAYLDEACTSDAPLRGEVERLLAAQKEAGSAFLCEAATHPVSDGVTIAGGDSRIGQRVGPYKIVKLVGEGGMGKVYQAVRADDQYQKKVAIKLVHAGQDSAFIVSRFRNERQILADLDHPNIARLLDGGTTDDGAPYFVMELIEGERIDEYCDRNKLTIEARLRLFLEVCAAVQHAHQHLIIHRDIKPGNIMVTSEGAPKLLDFGIAKILEAKSAAPDGDATQTLFRILTPAYASPEQVEGTAITTASDVYSLGVVLYELLTGARPLETKHWQATPLDKILRQLREDDPVRPSEKVTSDVPTSTIIAERRNTEPGQLSSLLRGDLDCIVMKALEKDPARRYATPSELAADLVRFINKEAVAARPSTVAYRTKKYILRHRVGVTVAAIVVTLLMAFGVTEFLQVKRITRERDRADRITEFMTGMFKVPDPSEARGNSVTAREILDKASKEIDTGLSKDPEAQAQLIYTMAHTYEGLGLYSRAHALYERAIGIQRTALGPKDARTLKSAGGLGWVLFREGHPDQGEKLIRQTIESQRETLGPEHPDILLSMEHLGWILREEGHYREAEQLDRETLALQRRVIGTEHANTLITMNNLAITLQDQGRYAEAEKLQREVVDIDTRVLGAEHPYTLHAMGGLAVSQYKEAHYGDAEKLQRSLLETERRVLGPEHPDTVLTMANLFNTLDGAGNWPQSEALGRETLELARRAFGPQHPVTMSMMVNLAVTLVNERHFEEAEKLQREALEACTRSLGPEHPYTLAVMNNLANSLDRDRHYAEAEKLQRETFNIKSRVLGREQPDTLESMVNLANTLSHEGNYGEAEKIFREALDMRRRVLGPDHPDTLATIEMFAVTLCYDKKYPSAESMFREAVDTASKSQGQTGLSSAWYEFARGAAVSGHRDEALQNLRQAINHGYKDSESLGTDKDFKSLHSDPRFGALLAELGKRSSS